MSFMEWVLTLIVAAALGGLFGALVGLIPFFVGKYSGKPNLGKLGWQWSMGVGVLLSALAFPVAMGFVIAILVKETDYIPPNQVIPPQNYGYAPPPPAPAPAPAAASRMGVTCLAGPLKGQTYAIGPQGMIIGRDHDCAIRFPSGHPGVSRHHCSLRMDGGTLKLTDMGSSHGTYLADGTRLPVQFPTPAAAGTRFYLASTDNLFQIVIV